MPTPVQHHHTQLTNHAIHILVVVAILVVHFYYGYGTFHLLVYLMSYSLQCRQSAGKHVDGGLVGGGKWVGFSY